MNKRIAFCADGTWETFQQRTNVYKLYKSLLVNSEQIPFYDDGVGSDGNPVNKLLGGAFGDGLWQKIKDGYTKIAHVYEAGDSIFLFGFSRGAYTVRSLAGMIAACGLPTQGFTDELVNIAFDAYRDKRNRAQLLNRLADCHMFCGKISMVGVWDTVGSLGIPAIFGGVDPLLFGFLDTALHPDVLNAYQALAIDEMRCQFPPTLWTSSPAAGQTLEQVWYCGTHSDVGGGYGDGSLNSPELSDIPLSWIMSKASALGLQIDPCLQATYTFPVGSIYALSELHSSWSLLYGPPKRRSIDKSASIANSVSLRIQKERAWRPSNLTLVDGAIAGGYSLVEVVEEPRNPSRRRRAVTRRKRASIR